MMVQDEKQMLPCLPDISTLLRVGHFYFALTAHHSFVEKAPFLCYITLNYGLSP